MNWLEQTLSPALVRALGWTLLHSLWQGAVVALALVGLLLLLRRHSAQVRYTTAAVALLTLLVLSAVTFSKYYFLPAPVAASETHQLMDIAAAPAMAATTAPTAIASAAAPAATMSVWQRGLQYFDQNMPVLVAAWLLGLLAMTLRMLGALAYVQRLRHYRVQPLGQDWQRRLAELAQRAGLQRPVQLLESARVKAPLVVGHLSPVILLPLGTVTGLSQAYMEAILAHELAHVARRDYLMNLLQSVAEILFFYHPAVWFMTACLRTERENCCDDMATTLVGGNPLTLARALAALAEHSLAPQATPRLALSAVGPDGSLLGRIRRLVQGRTAPTFTEGFMAACVVLVGLVLLSTAVALAGPRHRNAEPAAATEVVAVEAEPVLVPQTTALAPAVAPTEMRIISISADGKALAQIGAMQVSFDTTLNPNVMRQLRALGRIEGGGNNGTVVIKKDKKGRLKELYVDGSRVELDEPKGKKAKGEQVQIVQLPQNERFDEDININVSAITRDALRLAQREIARIDINGITHDALVTADVELSNIDINAITHDALREAEASLRTAERDAKTTKERERIQEERAELREKQQELRENLRERQQQMREEMEDTRREMEETRREMEDARREVEEERRDALDEALETELLKDGLIKSASSYQLRLSPTELTVNGTKQSAALQKKYLALYESASGRKLSGTGSVNINKNSTGRTNIISGPRGSTRLSSSVTHSGTRRVMPTPPAPPAAPGAPNVPAPPAPPTPPALDSNELRTQLRQDGLLGANEKSFQFQLDKEGLRVNGKPQSAALTAKYRRLYGIPTSGKTNRTVQMSVSE